MRTIAGGIVKYVGVQLLPCPVQRYVGQVVAPARLDMLWNGRVVERIALCAGDALLVADGAQIEPGTDVIERPFDARIIPDLDFARALLDARPASHEGRALLAPCDATVSAVDPAWIALRTDDARELRLRRPRRRYTYATVEVGERVCAGDALTDGERHHRALLHAWGAQRLGDHLLDELTDVFGDAVPRVYLALAVRAMMQGGQLRGIGALARERRATSGRTRPRGSRAAARRPRRRPPGC